jgi:hypothetical protein
MAEIIVVILVILGALNFFLSKGHTPKAETTESSTAAAWKDTKPETRVAEEGKSYLIRAGAFGLAQLDDFKEVGRLSSIGLKREAMEHALSSPGFLDLDSSTRATVLEVTWDGDWAHVVVDPSRRRVWMLAKDLVQ